MKKDSLTKSQFSTELEVLDQQLLKLLQERLELLTKYDLSQSKLQHLLGEEFNKLAKNKLAVDYPASDLTKIFELLNHQLFIKQQQSLIPDSGQEISIAYLGLAGSYSYFAAHEFTQLMQFKLLKEQGCNSFSEVTQQVEQQLCDYAVLPVENTSSGSINEVYDLLLETPLKIVAELAIDINHSLLGQELIALDQVEVIYSHPQPFYQCSKFLNLHCPNAKLVECSSTTHALKTYQAQTNSKHLVLANSQLGKLHNLELIAQEIANHQHNQTRFFILGNQESDYIAGKNYKTTLRFETLQVFGALVNVLEIFKKYQINLSKLESRPLLEQPWKEAFFVEIDGHYQDLAIARALVELEVHSKSLQLLGSYPSYLITHLG